MNSLPESLKQLIEQLEMLPGIGPKSAQRLAFHLLKASDEIVGKLSMAVANVKKGVSQCERCFSLAMQNLCKICKDPARDSSMLCIVENTVDLLAIEKTGVYCGLYHVLQGKISPLNGIGPEQLRLAELFLRLTDHKAVVKEVILALNPDLEGDTTALFIQEKLQAFYPLKVSRLARGIPSGGNLEYTDDATLVRALEGRQLMN